MAVFIVWGHHNGLFFFRDRTDVRRCARCGELLQKWSEAIGDTSIPKTLKRDVSGSYDGVTVVSGRFLEAYEEGQLTGLRFTALNGGFSAIRPEREVAYDSGRRGTAFETQCPQCGRFNAIAGATPAFLIPPVVVGPREFVRSDVEFGSNDEKAPLILCGADAAKVLKSARLNGLELESVRD